MTLFKNFRDARREHCCTRGTPECPRARISVAGRTNCATGRVFCQFFAARISSGAGRTHSREDRGGASQAGACAVSGPGNYGLIIKPVPEGTLPAYVLMAALASDQPVSDPSADRSRIVLCWLSNDVETPLPQLIDKEITDIEWDKHAVDVRT